ncbi:MAG: two-component regulator propeller domain-containing protein [Chitinophagaceae bacterium]
MNVKKIILLGLCAVVSIQVSIAQQKDINFISLTTEDGLSSNVINTILKDRYGMVWFATEDGLNKFDGTHFTVYRHKPGDSTSLQANEILALHEDKAGNLWIGTGGGSLNLFDRNKNSFINFPANGANNSIGNNVIRNICSDYTGKIWIAHFDGVNILDPVTKHITNIPDVHNSNGIILNKHSLCLFQDSHHNMWIGTSEGLYKFNPDNKSLTHFVHSNKDVTSLTGNNVNTITEDNAGNLWIGTKDGISKLSPGKTDFVNFKHLDANTNSVSSNMIYSISVDGEKLWIGTSEGLDIMDTGTGIITKFALDHRNIHSLTAKAVRKIYIDKQGIYWLGTMGGGIDKYDKNLNLFNYVRSNYFDKEGLNASIVSSFAENDKGKIFVGTQGGGVSLFDAATKLFQHYPIISKIKGVNDRLFVLAMEMSRKKKLLVGTFADGLFIVNPLNGKYQQITKGTGFEDINSNDIYCITEAGNGNFWIGTNGDGINILNNEYKVITRYTPNPVLPNDIKLPINGYIRDIKEDKKGNIWIATHGGGLAVLQPSSGAFTIYNTGNSKLPNDKVQSLLEDKHGNIWAGTFGGGLALFNNQTNQFEVFSEREGLQNSTIYKVIEDESGLIWISTNKGLSSINLATKKINNYNYHNGLQHNNFFHGSGIRLSNGELFFGGLEGFNYFHPDYLIKNNNVPPVLLTDLRISNQSVAVSPDGPIRQHISLAREINLDYKQNFALDFVGLSYTTPEQNQYAYKLEGFDKDWNYVGNLTTASYTNLDPGEYVFRVKASNNDGIWNNEGASIKVYVHPPFWRTVYAYIFYTVLVIGFLFYLRHKGIQKIHKKFAATQQKIFVEQERRESERIHQLDRLKIKFLTNLSHEFRTPISLILGPVDNLISQQKNGQSVHQLDMIKRNGRRLLNLVNQLLDFRKMEEQELKVHLSDGELVTFVKEVGDSFKDLAERKSINFIFTSQLSSFYTVFDHDKLERILFNVLSNAFKFTAGGGKIMLKLEHADNKTDQSNTWLAIKITDTGIGIPDDKKEKIFTLFFQNDTDASILNQGTGIGLSITREFVKMHGGTITVDSEQDKGTTFTILLPFTQQEAPAVNDEQLSDLITEAHPIEEAEQAESLPGMQTDMPAILLVEDNDDFRFYLKDNLRLQYKVIEAANGKEGWQKALSTHPQLIVSDISMPQMDGIELSRKIKSDKRTCHIPIILLTAMTGEEAQLRGLKTGANDYITKPFNVELLNAKIKNLLVLNTTLKNTYSKQIKVLVPEMEIQSADEKLLQKITRYLEENLSNPQLSVEELSRHVGMSRSSLYSKLLELTGQTPVEYIRSFKLDKAAALLEKSDMNIAQIAYSVGFSTPNYFAKSFKLKFHVLPSEYIHKMRNGNENNDHG